MKCRHCSPTLRVSASKLHGRQLSQLTLGTQSSSAKDFHTANSNALLEPQDAHNNGTMKIPLFPLDVVLFPDSPLPLHIFEERYREMFRECMAGT